MYKILKLFGGSKIIFRESDSASIPFSEGNIDYQEYLKWVEKGNVAEELDYPPKEA